MDITDKIKIKLESYKNGLVDIDDTAERIRSIAFNGVVPSLDLLESRLEGGCRISAQDGYWCLFESDGEQVTSGKTIRELMVNLIFTDE